MIVNELFLALAVCENLMILSQQNGAALRTPFLVVTVNHHLLLVVHTSALLPEAYASLETSRRLLPGGRDQLVVSQRVQCP